MLPYDPIKARDEVNRAFGSGAVFTATPDEVQRYFQIIATSAIPNPDIRHQEIVRGITLNYIQMARVIHEMEATISRLNEQNARSERWIVVLAIASLIATLVGIFA